MTTATLPTRMISVQRPRLQRRRVRLGFGPWIVEGTIGRVPNRLGLGRPRFPWEEPCSEPSTETFYTRLRVRRMSPKKA